MDIGIVRESAVRRENGIDWESPASKRPPKPRHTTQADQYDDLTPETHMGLIRLVAHRAAMVVSGDDGRAGPRRVQREDMISYAFEAFLTLKRMYKPERARFSTFFTRYGVSHTLRYYLRDEIGPGATDPHKHRPKVVTIDFAAEVMRDAAPGPAAAAEANDEPRAVNGEYLSDLSDTAFFALRARMNGTTLQRVAELTKGSRGNAVSKERIRQVVRTALLQVEGMDPSDCAAEIDRRSAAQSKRVAKAKEREAKAAAARQLARASRPSRRRPNPPTACGL
jgi:hypothetical protein